jgi:PAS domain S-box-containing protein
LIPLVFEIIFVASLALLLGYAEEQADQYEKSKEVLLRFHMAQAALLRSMTKVVSSFNEGSSQIGVEFDRAIASIRESRNMIASTIDIRPELADAVAPIPKLLDRAISMSAEGKAIITNPNVEYRKRPKFMREAALPLLFEFQPIANHLMRAEDDMRAVAPRELELIRLAVIVILVVGILFSIIISIVAARIFSRNVLRRLQVIEENAQLLAMRAPFKETSIEYDEIGKLTQALEDANYVLAETRRKELTILDVAADVICSLDKRLRFTAVGAASFPSWGYEPDELLAESLFSLHEAENEQSIRAAFEAIAQSGTDAEFDSQLICKNGSFKDILWKVNWARSGQSFYCVAHDISERKAAERMKQRFIAIASHDLRTPLSSISATLSVLTAGGKGDLPANTKQVLQKADNSLERLMDLIRDLLDLEKLEAGKVVISMSVVSAMDVCSAACDSLEFLAKSLGVQVARPFGDAALYADERGLVRVVINLLSNAIKFSPRGSTVKLTIENLGAMTEISVIDRGPGIPEEDRELIFEKFRQSKSTNSTAVKGTGLGLAISKLIAQAHGGSIGVDSVEGQGSRFYIRIPNFLDEEEEP